MIRKLLFALMIFGLCQAQTIQINEGDKKDFSFDKAAVSFVNSAKEKFAFTKNNPKNVTFFGLQRGIGYLYWWDSNNKMNALKVVVTGVKRSEVAKVKKGKGIYELYFKYDPVNSAPVNQRMMVHKYFYETDWNGYGMSTLVEYKNVGVTDKSNIEQLNTFQFALRKNQNFIQLGDDVIQYTALTAPYLAIQGAHAGLGLVDGFSLDVFGGKRPGGYWGDKVKDDGVAKEDNTNLSGARLISKLGNAWKLGITTLKRTGSDILIWKDTAVTGVDTQFTYKDLDFSAEGGALTAQDNKSRATQVGVGQAYSDYGWGLTYRDIDPKYTGISDYLYYRGASGWMLNGRVRPNKLLGINASYENYLQNFDREYYALLNERYRAENKRFRVNLFVPFVRPSFAFYENNRFNSTWKKMNSGFSLFLDQINLLSDKLSLYFEYSPWVYVDNQVEQNELRSFQSTAGLQSLLFPTCRVRLEHVSELNKQISGSGMSTNPRGYNFVLSLGDYSIFRSNVLYGVSYWYQNRRNSQETLDKNSHALKLSVHQSYTPDLYWYINGVLRLEHSLQYEYLDRTGYFYQVDESGYFSDKGLLVQSEVSGGFSYKF